MFSTTVIFHIICVVLICFFDIVHIVRYVFSLSVLFVKSSNFWRLISLFCWFQNVLSVHYYDVILSFFFLLLITHKSVLETVVVFSQFLFWNVFWFFWLFFLWIDFARFFFLLFHLKISWFEWFDNVCILVVFFYLFITLFVFSVQFLL